jgi:hypothetical protein
VQPRGRCGDAAGLLGVYRLISLAIARLRSSADIRRQWRFSDSRQPGGNVAFVAFEADLSARVRTLRTRGKRDREPLPESNSVAGTQPTCRTNERFPQWAADGTQQKDLGLAPTPALADKARRKDATAVENEEVARPQEEGQIAKGAVVDGAGKPVEAKKAGRIAFGRGLLGNPLRRQVEIEIFDLQKSLFCAAVVGGGTRPKC